MSKNYTYKDYTFGKTTVRYVILNDTKVVFMHLIPTDRLDEVCDRYETVEIDTDFPLNKDFVGGTLCHLHLSHHFRSPIPGSYKVGEAFYKMAYKEQKVTKTDGKTVIETIIEAPEGYSVTHKLTNCDGEEGFEVECTFNNNTGKKVTLEMISSATLDNITPLNHEVDHSESIYLHTFKSAWALEGTHKCRNLREMDMQKAWGGNFDNYKFGSQGSRPTADYFPYAVVEDRKAGVMWGMKLYHNATWQMEFSRFAYDISLSCGLGDASYGNWYKDVENGGSFTAPKAYIAMCEGDIADISDIFIKKQCKDVDAYGEIDDMSIMFNEWCTTWGKPTHKNMLAIADKLKDSKVKYLIIDAGWYKNCVVGDFFPDTTTMFTEGVREYFDAIRAKGFVPGIWMEYECVDAEESIYGDKKYYDMMLKHNGDVVRSPVGFARRESFWDFSNPDAVKILDENLIKLLKDNDVGYLKIDYNANIGNGCDGGESPGEGLRKHAENVLEYVRKIKREVPGITIENCASGGLRLDPLTLSEHAMCSFSDAHESYEIPVVAANLHYLVPPRQSQVWCVFKNYFDRNRMAYMISSTFLGRICWSGDILGMNDDQMEQILNAEKLYEKVAHIIRDGKSRIYRTDVVNYRNLKGTQAVVRYSDDGKYALLVYHCFKEPKKLEIDLDCNAEIETSLYEANVTVDGNKLTIDEGKETFGNVILLKIK